MCKSINQTVVVPSSEGSMLEYFKLILDKVSFSSDIFVSELKKAGDMLHPDEFKSLLSWAKSCFADRSDLSSCLDGTSFDFRIGGR